MFGTTSPAALTRPYPQSSSTLASLAGVVVLAVWVVVARGASLDLGIADQDESYYLMQGGSWLAGHPPYTALWDVKPPGLVLLFAALRMLATPGVLAARIATDFAVLAGALALHRFARHHLVGRTTALAAAFLYPPFTIVCWGVSSPPELLLAPFVILGMDLAAEAWTGSAMPPLKCLAAGLLFGCAVLIKQSAVFELALAGVALCWGRAGRLQRFAAFSVGAAAPSALFLGYGAAAGVDPRLYLTPFVGAFYRLSGDGISFGGGLLRFVPMMKPIMPLFAGGLLFWAERRALARSPDAAALRFVGLWIGASAAAIVAMRSMYAHYYLALVPPLSLAAAVWLRCLSAKLGRRRWIAAAIVACAAAYPIVYAPWLEIPDMRSAALPQATASRLRALGLVPGDLIYVADQDPMIYLEAGARWPTRYAFSQHLMCTFRLPDTDAETEIQRVMATRPRFVVVAHSRQWMLCERPDRLALVDDALALNYVPAGTVQAGGEAVDIYRVEPKP